MEWHPPLEQEGEEGPHPPMATGQTAPVTSGTVAVGGTPPPIMSGATVADNVCQKDMDTLEAEEESSCAKGCSKEATEVSASTTVHAHGDGSHEKNDVNGPRQRRQKEQECGHCQGS